MHQEVEQYNLPPTPYVPNSRFPVLVYRKVLQLDPGANAITKESSTEQIERNLWIKGGVFKAVPTLHFHSVTHEVYAFFRGSSTYLLGRGPLDSEDDVTDTSLGTKAGIEIKVEAGDVMVVPAGVAHCNLVSEGNFEYVGLYPEGSPKWDMNWCKADAAETQQKASHAASIPIPERDPVYGPDGPLPRIWRETEHT